MVREPHQADRAGGQDAVCFTAGPPGAYFGAGTVHAYLAADRPSPVVVAGISSGAVSAAALYKVYRDLDREQKKSVRPSPGQLESARWTWFRKYLEQITYSPLDFVWEAIPNPIDFFAQSMPVEDTSCPPDLKQGETDARIQYHRLIRLGLWFSGLRITVGDFTDLIVRYVRYKEGYALAYWQGLAFLYRLTRVGILLAWGTMRRPGWLWRPPVLTNQQVDQHFRPSPLFGFRIWGGSLAWAVLTFALPPVLAFSAGGIATVIALVLGILSPALVMILAAKTGSFGKLTRTCLEPMGLHRGLLHKYPLQRALSQLFEGELIERQPGFGFPTLMVVAAPVNQRPGMKSADGSNQQFWARTTSKMPVEQALLTALANPGLYAPDVYGRQPGELPIHYWLSPKVKNIDRLEMVDGSVIRTNPIPALFVWLRGMWNEDEPASREHVRRLFTEEGRPGRSLNIVYGVPLRALSEAEAKRNETINVVENGFASLALERRRDTELESRQTEFMSEFETHIRRREITVPELPMFPILPNPIAPDGEITFDNNLKPDRPTALKYVAQGCRRTLESLYANRLAQAPLGHLACYALLEEVAPDRQEFSTPASPGLSEVCEACTRSLSAPIRVNTAHRATYGLADPNQLAATFPKLSGVIEPQPRIVFLASGGVFRGTFHAGVLAAMGLARVKPDLVVGASVGAIAGAALAAQTTLSPHLARDHNHQLVRVFLDVDRHVALTKSLKNVTKSLGVRGRNTHVSPTLIRRLIMEGSRVDPSYAITGAPPILIDAISNLFLLPHEITRNVAAHFVAGHISEAMNIFWEGVQRETLRRLDIEDCIMGADLLEPTAKRLLFPPQLVHSPNPTQPYLPATAFFATATNVNRRMPAILGRDFDGPISRYNFLEACLASSAFPVVFAPRSESDIIPGGGSTRNLYSDGGIFDNLPFFPAITVLSEVQSAAGDLGAVQAYQDLKTRFDHPVLIIAAALDSDFEGAEPEADTLSLWEASNRLSANVKLFSFCQSAELVQKQVGRYLDAFADHRDEVDAKFVNSIVPNCVLPILPTDPEHLNGTFAFSRSTGLRPERVRLSIADGCFRTLLELSDRPAAPRAPSLHTSLASARRAGLIAIITRVPDPVPHSTRCPYFQIDGESFECHFTQGQSPVAEVHQACCADKSHR